MTRRNEHTSKRIATSAGGILAAKFPPMARVLISWCCRDGRCRELFMRGGHRLTKRHKAVTRNHKGR